jgi:hypothetical protein
MVYNNILIIMREKKWFPLGAATLNTLISSSLHPRFSPAPKHPNVTHYQRMFLRMMLILDFS